MDGLYGAIIIEAADNAPKPFTLISNDSSAVAAMVTFFARSSITSASCSTLSRWVSVLIGCEEKSEGTVCTDSVSTSIRELVDGESVCSSSGMTGARFSSADCDGPLAAAAAYDMFAWVYGATGWRGTEYERKASPCRSHVLCVD